MYTPSGSGAKAPAQKNPYRNPLVWLFLVLTMVACNMPDMPLPGITGKAGELVVVMAEQQWKGAAGDTAFAVLNQHVYGLPQPEPMFNVVHVKTDAFTKIFQTHRNIVVANIDKKLKARIELKNDVWAAPQVVIEISAPDAASFISIFEANASKIVGHVLKAEDARILKSYKAQLNTEVANALATKTGLKLSIPKGYDLVRDEEDFSWIRYETKDVTQSILVYSEPYTEVNTFTAEGMIAVMDRYAQRYIPGPEEGSFMTTYMEYPPLMTETAINGRYATQLKGLWRVEGALMGGPFICYAFLDAAEKKVYYVHGFVFAPGKNKRNYLRQVDAILNSAKEG